MSRQQQPRSRRHRTERVPRLRLLVVCLGRRTERDYLDALKREYPANATVKIIARDDDPDRCVRYAIEQYKVRDPAFDQVWYVFDVDEFAVDLHKATTRFFAGYDDVAKELAKALPSYDKTRFDFRPFKPGVVKAIDRAKRLEINRDSAREPANPSTGMWRLAVRIVGDGV